MVASSEERGQPIEDTKFSGAARDDPLLYPGVLPPNSFLLLDGSLLGLKPQPGRRLGQSDVIWHQDVEPPPRERRHERSKLNIELLRANATSMDARRAVLAYASNASPGQLHRKFDDEGISSVIPVLKGKIEGIAVGYGCQVAGYGAVPATVFDAPGATTDVFVNFVDGRQLDELDRSESNYLRVELSSDRYPLTLENGEILPMCEVYVSTLGLLTFEGEAPPLLAAVETTGIDGDRLTERGLLERLLPRLRRLDDSVADTPDDFVDQIGPGAGQLSPAAARALIERVVTVVEPRVDHREPTRTLYGTMRPGWSPHVVGAGPPVVPTSEGADSLDRLVETTSTSMAERARPKGDYLMAVSPEDPDGLAGTFVGLSNPYLSGSRSAVLAKVAPDTDVSSGAVALDQTLRNALGVEQGEQVRLTRVPDVDDSWLGDKILPRRYLVMRVQSAELSGAESSVCQVPQAVLDMLGISAGDEVVVEGVACSCSPARRTQTVLRAYPIPTSTLDQRVELQDNFEGARFPDCSELLGVFPDLPWIFLDLDARAALGVDKCAAVRIRPRRSYQGWKATREYALLFLLALIGAISAIVNQNTVVRLGLVGLALLGTAVASFWGLRKRLA